MLLAAQLNMYYPGCIIHTGTRSPFDLKTAAERGTRGSNRFYCLKNTRVKCSHPGLVSPTRIYGRYLTRALERKHKEWSTEPVALLPDQVGLSA